MVSASVINEPSDVPLYIGANADRLLTGVPPTARPGIQEESLRVLTRASVTGNTENPRASAQLVVGEVQSGKTLSFTTVMALARDNGYPLLVVIAGTKTNLLQQTERRLRNDLRMSGDGGPNPWRTWTNPSAADADKLHQLLSAWSDPHVPDQFKQTAVIFVLKHSGRVETVADLLHSVFGERLAAPVKALVIDDEADQASLNLKAGKDGESSVYAAITHLRANLSNHTYLMYTATPQAPLLVSIEDALAPDKVTVLTAGGDYVGSKELFSASREKYLREITSGELETALDPESDAPPRSLLDALAFWTLALVLAHERGKPRPLTMLVHPASAQDLHTKYDGWVRGILDGWRAVLKDRDDVAYHDLVADVFEAAYEDLRRTVPELPDVNESPQRLSDMLAVARYYLNQIEQRVVNSSTQAEIPEEEWLQYPGWIVIGGNKLDRGFTVQNLGVTYMPRGKGVGNVDTIQQRGRFFGYKMPYLDLLRGWFSAEVAQAFTAYVEHEKTMQSELRKVDASDSSLKEWRRKFLLAPELKLTRRQVMTLPTVSSVVRQGWVFRQAELFEPGLSEKNSEIVAAIRETVKQRGQRHPADLRSGDRVHHIASCTYEELTSYIYQWACSATEREDLDKVLFLLANILDEELDVPPVDVIVMDNYQKRDRRAIEPRGTRRMAPARINNLFQGRGSTSNYQGDQAFLSDSAITLQLHAVRPLREGADECEPLVPALAMALPLSSERRIVWETSE
ncbi:Z1 domain-containing protein [Actinomycetospora lutea]|uniref:Z1 domain-containing protein n=1 Tax=Actinomycetospora lutea TaxID=663604 RepID=UPI00236566FF|nr:Z1 domain-containing protein [Actinomycetospora lutea]MDD7939329.1 Z1 domain-containing protein [Actinomycetospora lutea]